MMLIFVCNEFFLSQQTTVNGQQTLGMPCLKSVKFKVPLREIFKISL